MTKNPHGLLINAARVHIPLHPAAMVQSHYAGHSRAPIATLVHVLGDPVVDKLDLFLTHHGVATFRTLRTRTDMLDVSHARRALPPRKIELSDLVVIVDHDRPRDMFSADVSYSLMIQKPVVYWTDLAHLFQPTNTEGAA